MAATNANETLTIVELMKGIDPEGDLMTAVDIISEVNPMLQDAPMVEANGKTYHKILRTASEPSGNWRTMDEGTTTETGKDIEAVEQMGILESRAQVDAAVLELSPNPGQTRMQRSGKFLRGMSKTLASALLYSDGDVNPKQITGLAPRLDTVDSEFVFNAGGSGGDTTSIFVVQWGVDRVHGIYPAGHSSVGIERDDRGLIEVTDSSSKPFRAWVDYFTAKIGLAVLDPRAIGRIGNIEVTGATNIFDEDLLIELLNNMEDSGAGATIYLNKAIKTQAEIRLKDKNNVNWSVDAGLGGVPLMFFRGNAVKVMDKIISTETAIA